MDFYKESEAPTNKQRQKFDFPGERNIKLTKTVLKKMGKRESYIYFEEIFNQDENFLFFLTSLATGLEEYEDLYVDFLKEHDFLSMINSFLESLNDTHSATSFNQKGSKDGQFIIVARIINSLMRMEKIFPEDLFKTGITKYFLDIVDEEKDNSRIKAELTDTYNAREAERDEHEDDKEWNEEQEDLKNKIEFHTSASNIIKLDACCIYFEYFAFKPGKILIKHCIPFFEYAQKYITDIPSQESQQKALRFMCDFIHNISDLPKKIFRRANRCAYLILTSTNDKSYPYALGLLEEIIEADGSQGHVVLNHFINIILKLTQSSDSYVVKTALDVITALLLIPEAPADQLIEAINVNSIIRSVGLIEDIVTISAIKVLWAIAKLGTNGTETLIKNDLLMNLIEFIPTASSIPKKGIIILITEMMKNLTPETAEFLLCHRIMKEIFSILLIVTEAQQLNFLNAMDNALSLCESSGTSDKVEEIIVSYNFTDILEELKESDNNEISEKAETFIDNFQREDSDGD